MNEKYEGLWFEGWCDWLDGCLANPYSAELLSAIEEQRTDYYPVLATNAKAWQAGWNEMHAMAERSPLGVTGLMERWKALKALREGKDTE